jgi:plastocyanin
VSFAARRQQVDIPRVSDIRRIACAVTLVVLSVAGARDATAQSLLERSPNVTGGWVGAPGAMHFNFLHRFSAGGAPSRKVTSSPTFLVAAGLPWNTLVGFNYATNSDVATSFPNEYEFLARWAPLSRDAGFLADVAVQGAYNNAARSADAELSIGRAIGPVRVNGAGRVFSDALGSGESKFAAGAGAVVRLHRWIAVAGDYAAMFDRPANVEPAWGAALQLAIPYSPHTFSIQVTNANTATLQGSSVGRDDRRWGFEFTIPVTLSRYFGRRAQTAARDTVVTIAVDSLGAADTVAHEVAHADTAAAPAPARPGPAVGDTTARRTVTADSVPAATRPSGAAVPARPRPSPTVRASMKQLVFTPRRIEIAAGTTVSWRNDDPLPHTVTADDGRWTSGIIDPGATWRRRFDRPGTYAFHCDPHPFMKGVIVVK